MPKICNVGGRCARGGSALCEEAWLRPRGILQERGSTCPKVMWYTWQYILYKSACACAWKLICLYGFPCVPSVRLSFPPECQNVNYIGLLKFAAVQSLSPRPVVAGRQSPASSFHPGREQQRKGPIQEIIPTYVLDVVPAAVNAKPPSALRRVFVPWKNC